MKKIMMFIVVSVLWLSSAVAKPTQIIFDTDMGNDVDDLMALQMLLTYRERREIDLLAITSVKANPLSLKFIDGYLKYCGVGWIDMGYVYDGPNPTPGKFLTKVLSATPAMKSNMTPTGGAMPVGYKMIRKKLAEASNKSVIIVAVGPLTNIRRLLESEPDIYSPLSGVELVKRKVKFFSIMGGGFDNSYREWNLKQDIESAQITFAKSPSPIIVSGYEIGKNLPYPCEKILERFGADHPMRMSYELFLPMPHNRSTYDLTSVLCAVEGSETYFSLSQRGTIAVDDTGLTTFEESKEGKHQYLILDPNNKERIIERLIELVSYKLKN